MERLPHDPKNFRDIVEADLRRAARLVIKVQDEIDPQFRVRHAGRRFHLAVMLPSDLYGRKMIFHNLRAALGLEAGARLYARQRAVPAG